MSDILDTPPPAEPSTTRRPPPEPVADPVRPGRRSWWWSGTRPLLMRLHFYVGMFVGPFILVAALTGLLYTLTPQIEQIVYRDVLTTPVGTTQLSLHDQVLAASAAVPDGTVTEIRPPRSADGTTRVSFDAPGVAEDHARTAFVDPYTGQVRGVLDTFGEWMPVRAWFDTLHRTLLLGDVGRVYSELAASWLGVLALSGLGLWVVRRRRHARIRRTLLPQQSARGRVRLRSWHGSVGLWAAVGMFFLAATGITWSQFAGANVSDLRSSLSWGTPSVSTTVPAGAGIPSDPASVAVTVDRVLATARTIGLSDPVAVTPGGDGKAWTVKQVQRSWPEKADSVSVDPSSGAVVDVVRFADWPIAAKLARWGIDAHMGLLFGVVNQILLAALALGIICLVVWGYRMWWLRRPTRRGAAAPGGTQRPGPGSVVVIGLGAIALGVFLPVLGVSLLVFLLGDAVRQRLVVGKVAEVTSGSRTNSV